MSCGGGRRQMLRLTGTASALLVHSAIRFVHAQPARGQAFRVYMILDADESAVETGFRAFLAEHGLALDLTVRSVNGDLHHLPDFVAEAKRLRPDLVYTYGADVTLGVVGRYDQVDPKRHITDIPVVYTMVSSPEGTRIVPSRRSSGRNVTGVDHTISVANQIRAIRAYRPMTRLAIAYNPGEANSAHNIKQLRDLSTEMDFELLHAPVPLGANGQPDATALPALVATLAQREPQFLYLGPDNFVARYADIITTVAIENRLPSFTVNEAAISRSNALIGVVNRDENVGRFTGLKAFQILAEGKRPAEIPNNTLARSTFLVNIAVARRLNLYPPMSVLGYAEIVR